MDDFYEGNGACPNRSSTNSPCVEREECSRAKGQSSFRGHGPAKAPSERSQANLECKAEENIKSVGDYPVADAHMDDWGDGLDQKVCGGSGAVGER